MNNRKETRERKAKVIKVENRKWQKADFTEVTKAFISYRPRKKKGVYNFFYPFCLVIDIMPLFFYSYFLWHYRPSKKNRPQPQHTRQVFA